MLQFYCGATQFVLGDLSAPTTPSQRLTPAVLRQEQLGWRLGITAYTFHKYTMLETIDKTAALGISYLGGLNFQMVSAEIPKPFNCELTDDELQQIRTRLDSAGIRLVTCFYDRIPGDPEGCRRVFEFARKMGIETLISEPDRAALDTIERFCDEYDVRLAIHNHDRQASPDYWSPEAILQVCQDRSPRVGACPDLGYWLRSGIDPVQGIRLLGPRLITLQLHDLHALHADGHDVPWGTGVGEPSWFCEKSIVRAYNPRCSVWSILMTGWIRSRRSPPAENSSTMSLGGCPTPARPTPHPDPLSPPIFRKGMVPMRSAPWLLMLVLCSAAAAADAPSLAGTHPNIVLVITDDQGFAPVGRHGHPWIQTPHLDQLHDASVRFTRFLVSPTCAPTRSALMTGRHPMRNGVTHTILERERMTLQATTLPQVLQSAGYTTGIFGKWHLGDEEPYQPENRGFDETFIHGAGGIGQAYDCSCADVPNNKYFDPVIRHNGSFVQTRGFCTDVFFTAALGWIQSCQAADRPFFAYITTNAPHAPYHAPPKNTQRFTQQGFSADAAGFYGMIENIDENVGRLLDKLQQWQLLDKTLIIFMSDNGMAGGRPWNNGKPLGHAPDGTPLRPYNAGMKGLKGSADEGGVRVPFYVRWDQHIVPGHDIDRLAAHIDIFPTLAALADVALPHNQVEGRSLLPLIENPQADWPDRFLFTHQGRWPTGANPDEFQWKRFAVRNQRFRFVGNTELFDLEQDPGQTTNVIAEHPDLVEQMRAQRTTGGGEKRGR